MANDLKIYRVELYIDCGGLFKTDCAVGRTPEEAQKNYEPKRKRIESEENRGLGEDRMRRGVFARFKQARFPGFKLTVAPLEQRTVSE